MVKGNNLSELFTDPAQHVAATLKFLHPLGDEVFEICLIRPSSDKSAHWEGRAFGEKAIVAGWFKDQAKAGALVSQVRAEGIYLTLNPCKEALLGRANERLKAQVSRTSDKEIEGLRNLLIDLDPLRPTGVSSTDNEHGAALIFALQIKAALSEAGWPAPLVGDSGNGAHLVYAIDLSNTPEHVEVLKKVLGALAQRYAITLAECGLDLDQKNFNPSRLSKLYGTRVGKGDNLPERPHRWAKIVELPAERAAVPLALLQDLASSFTPQASGGRIENQRSSEEKREGSFDLAAYLDHYGVEVLEIKPHGGSLLHVLAQCVFDSSHGSKEAAIGQAADGKLFYQCFHNSCQSATWAEARGAISGGDKLGEFVVGGSARGPTGGRKLRVVGGGAPPAAAKPGGGAPPAVPATEGLSWSDLGNARRLVAQHGKDLRYNHLNKHWYYWTGQRWAVDDCGETVRRAKASVESIYDEAKALEWESEQRTKLFKFALKSEASGQIGGMLNLARSEPGVPVLPEQFNVNPWLFNVANGTIDLRTGTLQAHRREDLITCLSPVAFEPGAQGFSMRLWEET